MFGQFDFDEFFDFFIKIFDNNPEVKCENKGSKVKVDNKVSSSTLVDKTTAILRKHSSTIKQTVTAKQNIIITCGDGKVKINPNRLRYGKHEKNIFGSDVDGTGCVIRGCCPEVNQVSRIKLAAIQKTALDDTVEMVTQIADEVEQSINVKVDGCGNKKTQEAEIKISDNTRDTAYKRVRDLVQKEVDMDVTGEQNIFIHFKSPLVCVNSCDEPPRSQQITQEMNIEALSRNIVDVVTEEIDKTVIEKKIESSISVDSSEAMNHFKGYLYSILSVILLVIIYIIFFLLAYAFQLFIAAYVFKESDTDKIFPKWSRHPIAVALMYITYLIWDILTCIFRDGKGILKCTGFLDWIKCTIKNIIKWFVDTIMSFIPGGGLISGVTGALGDVTGGGEAVIGGLLKGKNPKDAINEYKKNNPCASDQDAEEYILGTLEEIFPKEKCEPIQ